MNNFSPVQLSSWRANVDMQYCVSCHKVIEYCAKYATKCEPRSQPLKEIFTTIEEPQGRQHLTESHTEAPHQQHRREGFLCTCHLLLQIPMFRASWDFVTLSLDGSHAVEEYLEQDQPAIAPSTLDHYIYRPAIPEFRVMILLHFVQHFTCPGSPAQIHPTGGRRLW